ncbi:MAG TPA: 2,3,4,5-tetrahydropyridine-2,6-dicarboxylate N-succinyltransferase [Gammaproteobacteria bacterium]|nr:2,3,4,5-tetrahydropyridine-2,6-dicarboxylate N-succinyltransferase [Gammaproteobacteria bacterium]
MSPEEARGEIDSAFEVREHLGPDNATAAVREAVETAIALLDRGEARVAERGGDGWRINEWLKKAILLHFRLHRSETMDIGALRAWDKVPLKYGAYEAADFARDGVRVVPPATVRRGAFVARDCVLMPSYVNIGARIGAGSMVDTWATVGSCAQIGERVHISGGVGIGGLLEPLQAMPTIVEDDCFIGARSEIVEGVIVERGSVIGMGVYLGQSTRIYDRRTRVVSFGRVPAGSVVVSGALPAKDGSHSLYAAVIVKHVDAKTRTKTALNELLRGSPDE